MPQRKSIDPRPVKPALEQRKSPIRRQLNEGFCDKDGNWSPTKTISVFGLVLLLCETGVHFDDLIGKWDSLCLCLSFLICPDLVKKWLTMKYGGGEK
jgi:hypothetical protein